MKTINIKGKEYVPVVERVKEFHRLHPGGDIETELISDDGKRVVVKATVRFVQDYAVKKTGDNVEVDKILSLPRVFTGYSQAEWGKGMMGGVALEVAETSAIGRALGFANIGLLDDIASANEIQKNTAHTTRPSVTPKKAPQSFDLPAIDYSNIQDGEIPF